MRNMLLIMCGGFLPVIPFVNQSLSDALTNGQKQDFLKHFAKNHEDWQVKQAEAALRLYDYYLSELKSSTKLESPENKGKWIIVETDARTAMRLKHMSYSTEKTYLLWLRSFYGFGGGKEPDMLTVEDMQQFLFTINRVMNGYRECVRL